MLLVQLPPTMERDDVRLAYFFRHLPAWMRVAMEVRHPSWHCDHVFDLLAEYRAGYCVMTGAGLPCILRVTADFAYVRLTALTTITCTRSLQRRGSALVGRASQGVGGGRRRHRRLLQ